MQVKVRACETLIEATVGTHVEVFAVPLIVQAKLPVGSFAVFTPVTTALKATKPPAAGDPECRIVTVGKFLAIVIAGAARVIPK